MKNFIALCVLAFCLAHICVRPAQAKEIDCGWGKDKEWDDENYKGKGDEKNRPPEGACPPGPETIGGVTIWKWSDLVPDDVGGKRGANRVVKAIGYIGVRGDFAEPEIEEVIDLENPLGAHENKPTFYLGVATGFNVVKSDDPKGEDKIYPWQGKPYLRTDSTPLSRTTSDAGFQWEATTNDTLTNGFPGWKLFHRVTISTSYMENGTRRYGAWQAWVNDSQRWKQNALGETHLTYHVNEHGYAILIASGDTIAPDTKIGPYTTSLLPADGNTLLAERVEVRRSVGLTQRYPNHPDQKVYGTEGNRSRAIMDGSIVTRLNFSGGELTPNPYSLYNGWTSWTANGSVNGLYPDEKEDDLWVINFAKGGPTAPRNFSGGWNTGYRAENVEIHMGKSKKVEGK